jgi:hypothetical protein
MSANRQKFQAYEAAWSLKTFFKCSTQWLKSPIFSYYFKAKFKYEFQIQKVTDPKLLIIQRITEQLTAELSYDWIGRKRSNFQSDTLNE